MKDRILKMMQKEDVCIIMDFDYTITDYSSYSSIGVFKNYLGKKYCIRKEKIDNAISQLEKNNDELLEMLWRKKIDLLHEFVNEDFLNKINVSDNFIIRNEIKIILKKANELNIPVYIISSVCGEVIEKVLSDNRLDYNNIQIIANYILKHNNGNDITIDSNDNRYDVIGIGLSPNDTYEITNICLPDENNNKYGREITFDTIKKTNIIEIDNKQIIKILDKQDTGIRISAIVYKKQQ